MEEETLLPSTSSSLLLSSSSSSSSLLLPCDCAKLYSTILFVVSLLIAVATLLFLNHLMHGRVRLNETTNEAVKQSAFSPTVFLIYDRSTKDTCDRLINIMPFDWWVWACRNELYILNPEGGIKCTADSTPAVQVFPTQFIEVCLNLNYDSLLNGYTSLPCTKIPYEITSTVFTILSALNLLVKRWIKFDITEDGPSKRLGFQFTRIREDDDIDDDDDDDDDNNDNSRRYRRNVISPKEVIRRTSTATANAASMMTFQSKRMHTHLLDRVRAIMAQRSRFSSSSSSSLSLANEGRYGSNDDDNNNTITMYQHTIEHDTNLPRYVRSKI